MDRKEYLAQISASVRPEKKSKLSFMSSNVFKFCGIAVVLMIVLMIVGTLIGNGKTSLKDQVVSLKLHIENTSGVISDYQPKVKSSTLRSSSASLHSILASTSGNLDGYISEKYGKNANEKKLGEAAALEKDKLESDLFEAKITGILDRIYAHKMAYEISLITSEEASIFKATSDESLKQILTTSYNSLENLYANFNDFSENK